MRYGRFEVHAPLILGGDAGEAEIFGASVWLWMHSFMHRDAPLHLLSTVLLPVIKHRQFVVVSEGERPVFFLSWMWLNEEAEKRYLTEPTELIRADDWRCGERIWFRDFIAPFGHTAEMFRLLREEIFAQQMARMLWHRGEEKGIRVKTCRGRRVSTHEAHLWKQANPLAVDLPEY